MLVVVSPAKRLDWNGSSGRLTEPAFQKDAARLASHARALTLGKLKRLMDLSDDLARLNRDRFKAFMDQPTGDHLQPAIFAFAGDTYLGLDARSLSQSALDYAQEHLRILSGLYGVLRPFDGIQPYRLEMGSRLKTRRGASLYDYWRDIPAKALNQTAEDTGSTVLVNCASQEYFRVVDLKKLTVPLIETAFFELKDGSSKMISFFVKRARGSLARYIVENQIRNVADLKGFCTDGYRFDADQSSENRYVFTRPEGYALSEAS